MANVKVYFAIGLVAMALVGLLGGFLLSGFISRAMVSDEAKATAKRVGVKVLDTGEEFFFDIDDPLTKLIYYQSGGQLLATGSREDVDWQLVLGHEDWPSQGKGDCADVILKISKVKSPAEFRFEVACLGSWNKQIYLDRSNLILDTSSGIRWKQWSVPV